MFSRIVHEIIEDLSFIVLSLFHFFYVTYISNANNVTNLINMELTGQKKVHIVPMGFEIDRIEIPLRSVGTDRVYLVIDENEEKGLLYLKELSRRIKKQIPEKEFKVLNCPMWDFRQLMSLLCELVRKEKSAGNFVYINLSSGSKLSAIAGTLASLMYGAVPYYAQAEKYNIEPDTEGGEIRGITSGVSKILKIPLYTIEPPADELINALAILSKKRGRISQKDYIFQLEERGLLNDVTVKHSRKREVTKKGYAKAKRWYFERLVDKGWIIKKGKGRSSYIEITEEGKNTFETFIKVAMVENKRS
jgi:predicted transcriptional regulator